jgi:FtsP/CotA-like multicopper oxidase with cupredoxin domain
MDGRATGAAQQLAIETATTVNADGRDVAQLAKAVEFGTNGWPQTSPETPHKVKPDIEFYREVYGNGKLRVYDGTTLNHWGFEDEKGERSIPSPLMRVREGQIVHVTLKSTKGPHTIHHHGIEPDAHNDGAGHTSFDVGSRYTYQWRATEAGTFFYHCHVNTPLHVQLGLFGGLIVDPESGPGTLWKGGPVYDHERFWVGMAMDPAWANLDHHAGVQGENAGLNRLQPKYFFISGKGGEESLEDDDIAIRAKTGETVLMRLLNANYHPQRWTWDVPVECVCSDGRPFGYGYDVKEMTLAPAERYDMVFRPRKPGVYRVRCETLHWITGKVLGYAETLITVRGDALPDPEPAPTDPYPEPDYGYGTPSTPAPSQPAQPYVQGTPDPAAAAAPAPAPAAAPAQAPVPKKPSVRGTKVSSNAKRKLTLKQRLKLKADAKARARAKAKAKAEAKLRARAEAKAKARAKAKAKAAARKAKKRPTGKAR